MLSAKKNNTIIIEPPAGLAGINLLEIWNNRQILFLFFIRDVMVRYKHTVLGFAWVIIQPAVMTLVLTLVIGRVGHSSNSSGAFPVFTFAAFLAWTYFSNALNSGGFCIVVNRTFLTKVYFPRLIIPMSVLLPGIVDLTVAFMVVLPAVFYFGIASWKLLAMPVLVLYLVYSTFGLVLWLSTLLAYYRDFRVLVPFLMQFMMFASPVAYGTANVPAQWKFIYCLNPLVGPIECFRWSMMSAVSFPTEIFLLSFGSASILLISGLFFFTQVEPGLADVV